MDITPEEKLMANWGFCQNPFEHHKAEDEEGAKNLIDPWSFFVKPKDFHKIISKPEKSKPKSSIIFADRGEGKSFLCKRVLQSLRKDTSNFIVEYINFSDYKTIDLDNATIDSHLDKIIRLCLKKTVYEIKTNKNTVDKLDPNGKKRLSWFIDNYYDELFDNKEDIKNIWEKKRTLIDRTYDKLKGIARLHFIKDLFRRKIDINIAGIGGVSMYEIPAHEIPSALEGENPNKWPTIQVLNELVALINSIGFKSIYVIIDKLDESELAQEGFDSVTKFISPLLINSPYLEIPDLCMKIFIPKQIGDIIERNYPQEKQIRRDRIDDFEITWDADRLRKMLKMRLNAYSDNKIESITNFLDPNDVDIDEFFENNLLFFSAESPRNLNRIMGFIISEVAELYNDESKPPLITREAIILGIKTFLAKMNLSDYERYTNHRNSTLPKFREDLLIQDI